ncbi:exodeoxyribonuclease VII large subunit [Dialister succinatiphilus]|uniref:exodeoxyribonuclease VII large subunit n=1 Tax=Dialister succinatiphilus TaxID=487173 RepID=UPI003AB3ECD7
MKIYSVNECTRLLAGRMKKDYIFSHVAVRGTISSVHTHFSGVTYFTLLGEESRLFCVIGRMGSSFLTRNLMSGMEATVIGDIRFNTLSGWPSLFVERVMDIHKSRNQEEKEDMVKELERECYFDPLRKKGLPSFPFHIGIISSESGAVVHDIVKTAGLRNPCVRFTLYSTSVQGEEAARDMADRIREACRAEDKPDILILARGGGAEDDLSPFNERILLDAIHESTIPLISAVGHETDTTLSDLTADRRASTPTQAAEIAIPERAVWLSLLRDRIRELEEGRKSCFLSKKQEIADMLISMKEHTSPKGLQDFRREIQSQVLLLDRQKEMQLKSRYRSVLELLMSLQKWSSGHGN